MDQSRSGSLKDEKKPAMGRAGGKNVPVRGTAWWGSTWLALGGTERRPATGVR